MFYSPFLFSISSSSIKKKNIQVVIYFHTSCKNKASHHFWQLFEEIREKDGIIESQLLKWSSKWFFEAKNIVAFLQELTFTGIL